MAIQPSIDFRLFADLAIGKHLWNIYKLTKLHPCGRYMSYLNWPFEFVVIATLLKILSLRNYLFLSYQSEIKIRQFRYLYLNFRHPILNFESILIYEIR